MGFEYSKEYTEWMNGFNSFIPTKCAWCGFSGIQTIKGISDIFYNKMRGINEQAVVVTTLCENCLKPAAYLVRTAISGRPEGQSKLLVPLPEKSIFFSDYIDSLSPRFVKTFQEASLSDTLELHEIAGMGYRKALEILVTDYVMNELHTDEDTARKRSLSQLIDLIPNEQLTNLAKASTWIGNDETHYFRTNPDYGIEDIKAWISAFIKFLEMNNDLNKATELINKPKKKANN